MSIKVENFPIGSHLHIKCLLLHQIGEVSLNCKSLNSLSFMTLRQCSWPNFQIYEHTLTPALSFGLYYYTYSLFTASAKAWAVSRSSRVVSVIFGLTPNTMEHANTSAAIRFSLLSFIPLPSESLQSLPTQQAENQKTQIGQQSTFVTGQIS